MNIVVLTNLDISIAEVYPWFLGFLLFTGVLSLSWFIYRSYKRNIFEVVIFMPVALHIFFLFIFFAINLGVKSLVVGSMAVIGMFISLLWALVVTARTNPFLVIINIPYMFWVSTQMLIHLIDTAVVLWSIYVN